jgi:hypothetical protein
MFCGTHNILQNIPHIENQLQPLGPILAFLYMFLHLLDMRFRYGVLGEITPSYILHTRAFGTYLFGGLFTLQKEYKVMVFYM